MSDLSRQSFVTAAAAIGLGVSALKPHLADAAPASKTFVNGYVPFTFDRKEFNSLLARSVPHRQVTSALTFDNAAASLKFLMNSVLSYADPNGFAAGVGTLEVASVYFGGPSPAIAVDDSMWAKYPLALMQVSPQARGGFDQGSAPKANQSRDMYEQLAEHGALFFVCNNALSGLANDIARTTLQAGEELTHDRIVAIHSDLVAHFLPNTYLVPTGVGALIALQEARFTYLPSH